MATATLTVHDHSRDSAGFTYVYPVVSRRAGGVSIGINLNPNNACNWACIYCQVPDLVRGAAPVIALAQLETELRSFLTQTIHGDWLQQHAHGLPVQDIAFSGNGEPTSAKEFGAVVAIVGKLLQQFDLTNKIKVRLITNGSLMQQKQVQQAIADMAAINGEVWFKVDRATSEGMAQINQVNDNIEAVRRRLLQCAALCPTWVQTCWFAVDGSPPGEEEFSAYLRFLEQVKDHIVGVHFYGIARPSMQPAALHLSALPAEQLAAYAEAIRKLGIVVNVSP
jgi:wyosine [tRNA(Phe)-imidazoG37] synthetase (radical SAM superfamily)